MLKKKNVFKIRRKKTWSAGLGVSSVVMENRSLRDIKVLKDFKIDIKAEEIEQEESKVEKFLNESMITIELDDLIEQKTNASRQAPLNDAKDFLNRMKDEYSDIYDEVG